MAKKKCNKGVVNITNNIKFIFILEIVKNLRAKNVFICEK